MSPGRPASRRGARYRPRCATAGDAVGERLDIALDIVEPRDLARRTSPAGCGRRPRSDARTAARPAAHACSAPGLRKSGRPQAAQSRADQLRRRAPGRAPQGSSASRLSTARSIASGAARSSRRDRPALRGGDQRVDAVEIGLALAPVEEIERGEAMLLDRSISSGVNRRARRLRASARRTCRRAGGARRGRRSAPSRRTVSRRGRWPSNLARPAKATWSTSMLRPMPIASVATR